MTRTTEITSDLDKTQNNTNSRMVTVAIFDNNDQNNKTKYVFDCGKEELVEILNKADHNGISWKPNND